MYYILKSTEINMQIHFNALSTKEFMNMQKKHANTTTFN